MKVRKKKRVEAIIEKIREMCESDFRIVAVYIFGSFVTKNRTSRDIDIAILLKEKHVEDFPILSFIAIMEKKLSFPVDVIILNKAEELLKYEIRKNGRLIFERDPYERKRFEIISRKNLEDFLFLHKRYINRVLYRNG